jgi:hypothetical protein
MPTDDFVKPEIPPPVEVDACKTALIGLVAEYREAAKCGDDEQPECDLEHIVAHIEASTDGIGGLSGDNKKRFIDSICCTYCGREGQAYTWDFDESRRMFDVDCKSGTITKIESTCAAGGDHYGYIREDTCKAYKAPTKYSYASNPDLCALLEGAGGCGDHGDCASGGGSCNCKDGWGGPNCDSPPGYPKCIGATCLNDGECVESTGKCKCTSGYTGPNCQFTKPVVSGSTSVSVGVFSVLAAVVSAVALL